MRLVSKLHRQPGLEAPAITVDDVLAMATLNAAAPTGFGGEIGALEPGRRADMVLIRLNGLEEPYLEPDTPPAEVVLGRAKSKDVAAVIVDGEVLLRDGIHSRASKADVAQELREQLARPLEPEDPGDTAHGRPFVALRGAILPQPAAGHGRAALRVQRPRVAQIVGSHSRFRGNGEGVARERRGSGGGQQPRYAVS